jgi:aryl-phospho-beta-D-glucosidase BglC (GH1 family)
LEIDLSHIKRFAFIGMFLTLGTLSAASSSADLSHLSRGINLWEWFTVNGSDRAANRAVRRGKIGANDIENIRRAGFNNVRIGITPYSLLPAPLPASPAQFDTCATLHDDEFVADLEDAISAFKRAGIAVVVNARFEGPAKDRLRTDREFAVGCLGRFWAALALDLAGKFGPRDVYFDLINEPDIITSIPNDPQKWQKSADIWGGIQSEWIAEIRHHVSSDYVLILSSDGWGTSFGVPYMRKPAGPNLVMSFHYYASEVFTHQGQVWYNPLLGQISNLAYPPSAESCKSNMTKVDRSLNEGWYENLVKYCANKLNIAEDLAQVRNWSAANGDFPVWVGEFGALAGAPPDSRIRWYKDVLSAFKKDAFVGHALVDYFDRIACDRMKDQSCVFVSDEK